MTPQKYIIGQGYKYDGNDRWKWWIWIEATNEDLDLVEKVVYTLHPTFPKPVRIVENRITKFKLETGGWGTFMIYAKLVLKDGSEIKLQHYLELNYNDDDAISPNPFRVPAKPK